MTTKNIMKTVLTVGIILGGATLSAEANAHDNDNYCREFNQEIRVNGHYERAYGTACLQPNGTWKIVSKDGMNYSNDLETTYVIKRTYVNTSPFLISFYSGHDHHYNRYDNHRRYYKNKKSYRGKSHNKKKHH